MPGGAHDQVERSYVTLRMSTLFLRTLREDPADAEVPSHRLLVRAGYIRRVAAGIYSWLPLGKIVFDNVAAVVRAEMARIGAQEVLFPALLPREPYDASGRWDEYGPQLFRLRDRRGGDYLLGPTHEEMFTLMVKGEYASYKDFPVILYQIQTKYRDEARPRSGVIRGREFVMKDSYSFDLDDEGLQVSYDKHRDAYVRTFDRLGLDYRIVSAVSGAMGGSHSEEFLAPSPIGEDTYVTCTKCEYAANVEAVTTGPPDPARAEGPGPPPPEVMHTPGTPTIESLVDVLNAREGHGYTAADTLKNILVKITEDAGTRVAAVLVPGDREVDLGRLDAALSPATVELFGQEDFDIRPELVRGYVGPQDAQRLGITIYADARVLPGSVWVTGANRPDHHAKNVVAGRDFSVDHYLDVATVAAGDPCPQCGGTLEFDRAIEVGHIFQLGRKYSDAFSLDALGPDGRPVRVTMGSYGIGVSRAVAALAEQRHDERGLCWPREVAPADVHIVATGKGDQLQVAGELAARLEVAGVRVLLDDRPGVSPGVRFTDAELIGVPTILVVGRRLVEGQVELRDRGSGESHDVAVDDVVARVAEVVR
ncbi:MAG: proline--tRNA ligase [Carbonactinosporaceae bacterium]